MARPRRATCRRYGGGSRVRRQYLPHAERIDTGIVGIAGKVSLDDDNRERIAPELRNGMTLVSGNGGYSLFVAVQETGGVAVNGIGGNDEFRCGWCAFRQRARLSRCGPSVRGARSSVLTAVTPSGCWARNSVMPCSNAMAVRAWDERFRKLVRLADPATINAITMRTAVPVAPWRTQRITLGDAIHSMTPYRGIGANVALKDAVRLCARSRPRPRRASGD